MKYKLLKDLPFAKAGEVFERVAYKSKNGLSDYDYLKISKQLKDGEDESMFTIDYGYFLGNFSEWFEGFQEGGVHYKPKFGDIYWRINVDGETVERRWQNDGINEYDYLSANTYRELEEVEQARERKLAEIRLRRTSTFEPDWEDGLQKKYVVIFNHVIKRLEIHELTFEDLNLPVYFESEDNASRAIYKYEADWLKYFGIKEED